MSKQIYNEGRVVGLSQYEIFVKNWLSNTATKDIDPPSEQEWLASIVGPGNSLLLTIPSNTAHSDDEVWIYETYLPEGSNLCGCNPVIASLFIGYSELLSDSSWAKYVNNYGDCIVNDSSRHPSGQVLDPKSLPKGVKIVADQIPIILEQYVKILDGVVLQGGTWEYESTTQKSDFSPNFSSDSKSLLRIQIKGKITKSFSVLFTGLNYKSTIQGVSGLDGSINKAGSENGAYLGPAQYPWACKVIFTLPSAYTSSEDSKKHVYVVYGSGDEGEAEAKQLAQSLDEKGLVIYRDNLVQDASGLYSVTQDNEGNYQLYSFGAHAILDHIMIGGTIGSHFDSLSVPGTTIINDDNTVFHTFNIPTIDTDGLVPGFKVDPQSSRDVDYTRWSDLAQAMHDSISKYEPENYSSETAFVNAVKSGSIYCWSNVLGTYSLLSVDAGGATVRDSSGNEITWSVNETFYKKLPDSAQFKLDILGPSLRQAKKSLLEESPYLDFNGIRLYVSSEAPVDSFYYQILSAEEAPSDWLTVKMSDNKYFALKADGKYVPVGQTDSNPSNYTEYKPNIYYEKIEDIIPDGSIGIGW